MLRNCLENIVRKILNELFYREHIVITSHRNADPDALASAIVLSRFIQTIVHRRPFIVFPEGLNEVSKKIVRELDLWSYLYEPSYLLNTCLGRTNPLFIVVDTCNSGQLGVLKDIVLSSDHILVDHHRPGDLVDNAIVSISDPGTSSTSELVYRVIRRYYGFDKLDAILLLAGILYDTRRFLYASPNTLWVTGELLRIEGVDYRYVLELLRVEMDISERIARLKAMQRLNYKRIGEYIIAYTHVSAYESSVARSLIDLGADVAVVASSNKELRVVTRSRQDFYRKLGISLGRDIMPLVAEYLGGSGGGHDTAAVATGKGDLVEALEYTVSLIAKLIKARVNDMK